MGNWLYTLAFLAVMGVVMSMLYRQGFMVTKSIAAVLFWFQPGRNGDSARLTSCSGWVRHAYRLRESRIYEFSLNCQLTGGDAEVLLLDGSGQQLLRLNKYLASGQAELDQGGRYYLRWEFRSATGTCALRWQ